MSTDWDSRWMAMATAVAGWSKDRSRGVGAVIIGDANQILATGYNGFPRGVDDNVEARHERPAKYVWTEHAERNAIYNAARTGVALAGSTMYLPWFPCADCARAIVQSGVALLVAVEPVLGNEPKWDDDFRVARELLGEAGVAIRWYVDEYTVAVRETVRELAELADVPVDMLHQPNYVPPWRRGLDVPVKWAALGGAA